MEVGYLHGRIYHGVGMACFICRLSDRRNVFMNWQEWVVGLLIVLCVARILYGIYLFFRRVKENDNPCASCASGCELKDMMEKKQKECSSKKKNTKKNCCR